MISVVSAIQIFFVVKDTEGLMNAVLFTSGPRGSGKSTYVKEEQVRYPDIITFSRDEVLISLFGKTSLNPYEG